MGGHQQLGPKLRLADDLTGPAHKEMPTSPKSLQEIETDHIIRVLEKETFGARFLNRLLLGFAFRNNTGKM